MLNLVHLKVLAAVARHESVTEATRELHYSQPSVGHHLSRVEGRLARGRTRIPIRCRSTCPHNAERVATGFVQGLLEDILGNRRHRDGVGELFGGRLTDPDGQLTQPFGYPKTRHGIAQSVEGRVSRYP